MTLKRLTLFILVTAAFSTAARAQVEVTVTGSTAFRAITINRAASIFDAASLTAVTNDVTTGLITYTGTVSNKVLSLGATQVKVRLSFSGSASGMNAVKNQTAVNTAETQGVNVSKIPDLALSDVFPSSATPPIPESAFERTVVGVVPFAFVKNNNLAGITSLTREQAVLLMTASGDGAMPPSYLGGTTAGNVYLVGRDSGSGSRITVEKDIGFIGSPLLWATNGNGGFITTNGFSSGGLVRTVVGTTANTIGYLSPPDFNQIAGSATPLAYNGVSFSEASVANGSYALWGYEHLVNRVSGLSANQKLVRDAIISAITDPNFQSSNTLYKGNFVSVQEMKVERGADGGIITSLEF